MVGYLISLLLKNTYINILILYLSNFFKAILKGKIKGKRIQGSLDQHAYIAM